MKNTREITSINCSIFKSRGAQYTLNQGYSELVLVYFVVKGYFTLARKACAYQRVLGLSHTSYSGSCLFVSSPSLFLFLVFDF